MVKGLDNMKRSMLFAILAALGLSCSDLGNEPGGGPFQASTIAVSLGAGGQATVTISGGLPPYTISEAPDPALASASLSNPVVSPTTVVITAASVSIGGNTRVKIRDSHSDDAPTDSPQHGNEITIAISVSATPALIATPSAVTVGTGTAQDVQISGGNPPYRVDTAPNPALASAQILNPNVTPAVLRITGVTTASVSGSTSVKVKDGSSPNEREVTVGITKIP